MASRLFLFALASALLFLSASACVHVYGDKDDVGRQVGSHYTYSYNGLDWANDFPQCRGEKQSPVLLPSMGAAAQSLLPIAATSTFTYGALTNPLIINNGHTLQVPIPDDFQSDVRIPIRGDPATATGSSILDSATAGAPISYVKATPAQFHFHTHSEHIMSGASYPLELHIVHFIKKDQLPACGDAGCPAVLGIMFALTDDESLVSPDLRKLVEAMPLNEGLNATVSGVIDLNALLPQNRTYFTYEGSLTTPPCTEGILWHVLATPIYISQTLLTRYQEAVGSYDCPDGTSLSRSAGFHPPPPDAEGCTKLADGHNFRAVQPLNGRSIFVAA